MFVNFKVALAEKGERQFTLALRCGIDPTLLSLIINERREASLELRSKLAAVLGVSERWLFMKRPARARAKRPEAPFGVVAPAVVCVGRE